MKKQTFLMGIFSLILIFGLILIGCPTDGEGGENKMTKFEGTWRNPNGNHSAYTFVNDTYTLTNNSGEILSQGTFTFTDTTITFIPVNGEEWTQTYTLEGDNNLALVSDNIHSYGQFIKNWEPQKTKFEGLWKNGSRVYSFSFDDFEFLDTSQNVSINGKFTFTGTTITFIQSNDNRWTQDYTLENNVLTLEQPQPQGNGYGWGNFTKQPE
jgi:hypothetical protein